jgi:hypothetical protein
MIREARRFSVATCGRRFGKTTLGEDRVIEPALRGQPVAWFAPTYKMLTEVWRDLRAVLAPVTATIDKQQHRIELVTGGVLEMWSLDGANAPRGRKYASIVIDEAGFVADLEYAWNAVIRPTLMDYRGSAWFLGTPKGRTYFWQLWQRGQGDDPEWISWQMPTLANPYIDPAEIEAARLEMPERTYLQEIEAAFLDDGGGVFRGVRAAATSDAALSAAVGHSYAIGVDWAQLQDWTVLSVLDTTERRQVALDRFNKIDYGIQRGRLMALWETFGKPPVIAEVNSIGRPVIEQLLKDGVKVRPFTTTNMSKADAVEALSLAFERGDIRILPDPVQLAELEAYEAERLPSGLLRYNAPTGMHDDTVIALALAWQAVAKQPIRLRAL